MKNFKTVSTHLLKEDYKMYDIKKIRKDFPMLNNNVEMQGKPLVFLDNASTTFKPQCVMDKINEYYTTYTSNSHRGDYDLCFRVDNEIEAVRKKISSFINSQENEVVFTSGTTMSINLISYGYARKYLKAGDEILVDEAEHASNLLPWFKLVEEIGVVIKYIPLDEKGCITKENLCKSLTNHTKIVSLAMVSNVLGNVIDVKGFAPIIHEAGALFVVDGAQAVPHMKVDFASWDIDFLSFSAHKMCGPTGVGCLVGKYDLLEKMDSFLTGGGMNVDFYKDARVDVLNPPAKFEAGTLNIAGIIGFGAAVDYISSIGIDEIRRHELELHEYAIARFKELEDIIVYNPEAESGIITFNRKDVFAQDEATLLNYKGIAVRSGLHCAKILVDYLGVRGTVRASTYLYTTKEDIDRLIEVLKEGGDILDAYFN